jgi:hypothetical protein
LATVGTATSANRPDADHREQRHLRAELAGRAGVGGALEPAGHLCQRHPVADQCPARAGDDAQVVTGGAQDVDPGHPWGDSVVYL